MPWIFMVLHVPLSWLEHGAAYYGVQKKGSKDQESPCGAIFILKVMDKNWADDATNPNASPEDGVGPPSALVKVLRQNQIVETTQTRAQTCNQFSLLDKISILENIFYERSMMII